jgi:hypothetical protein
MAIGNAMQKDKACSELQSRLLLEQYRQAWIQRQREGNVQLQLLAIGNTILGGMLIAAMSVDDILVSALLCGAAIPVCFFLYVAYRKHAYFEDLFSENIEAIERRVGDVKHLQYDTYPHKEASAHYVVRYPKKRGVQMVTSRTVMYVLLLMYAGASHLILYRFASQLLPQWVVFPLVLAILPLSYGLAHLLGNPARIGETKTEESNGRSGAPCS